MFYTTDDFALALRLETTFLAYGVRVTLENGWVGAWTNIRRRVSLPQFLVPIRPEMASRPAKTVVVPATAFDHRAGLRVTNAQFSDDAGQTDNMEITLGFGAALDEAKVRADVFEGARFDLLIFDWRTPVGAGGQVRAMLRMRGDFGERTIKGREVTWKLRSLANRLRGDVLECSSRDSRARWGDPELEFFNLNGATHDGFLAQVTSPIAEVDPAWPRRKFRLALPTYPDNRFADGMTWFQSGQNTGFSCGILLFDPATGWFSTTRPTPKPLQVGDTVRVRIRAPRTIEEWRLFFGSGKFFAGEPGIPTVESANRIKD